jgi:hypothetical protein
MLWFCIASHDRYRVHREDCTNVTIVQSGHWGSAVIAVCHKDHPAEIVFYKKGSREVARLECGVVVRSMAPTDRL